MTGKLVILVEIDDDDSNKLGEYIDDPNLIGVYKSPTKFCMHLSPRDNVSFRLNRKYQWMVCSECGKPVRTAFSTVDKYLYPFGRNMIDRFIIRGDV